MTAHTARSSERGRRSQAEVSVCGTSNCADSPWSPRESELLSITLELLEEHGYDRLSVDSVATTARASKSTLYRRWPTKAELVAAAFVEGTRQPVVDTDTGTLRGDLLQIGEAIRIHVDAHAGALRAILVKLPRNANLADLVRQQFLDQPRESIERVHARAVDRGEVRGTVNEELWDLLPGYLIYKTILTGRAPSRRMVQHLVDTVLLPSLNRRPGVND
ncbi:TetR/AcrR family transcriptional regulator [Mycolicibacterium sp. lyk4-40-TYG-92]|uniref:TetR/AcrR family transcriptional regulator n=1 Tax=Mycolicibacterium sp. lyk4-40-TYG-92 TaxID=3040295 RepID=UPI0025511C5A|nr:TetR/AcrR family transcriptional regulator [Mycolicibacterium sp. lyk4-40-TYG-92]